MKRLFFTLSVALFSCLSNAQELNDVRVFQVLQTGSKYSNESLLTALSAADWCGMINPTSNYIITFEDDTKVQILSKKSLDLEKIEIDDSCVRSSNEDENAVYKIAENGYIIRLVSKNKNSKNTVKQ